MNNWVFRLADDRNSVLLEFDPSAPPPDVASARAAFEASEFSGYRLNEAALAEVLADPKKTVQADPGQPAVIVVAQRQDAVLKVRIADDGLSATATVTAAYQGKHVTTMDVAVASRTAGVTTGLIMHNIAELVRLARAARPGEQVSEVIAQGKAPVPGEDAWLEQLTVTLKDRVLRPREKTDGTVDMHDLGELVTVHEGEPLMRRHPPRPGEDGLAVTGDHIAHRPGEDLALTVGDGSGISAQDSNLLVATRSGIPRRVGDSMDVDEVLTLDKVDLGTGNIDFKGCVLIKGDVAEDMQVRATGDVSIGGVVESAAVEAQGDLLVHDGIIGHKVDAERSATAKLSARLWAGGELVAKYAQNADLQSAGSVRIAKYLFHSQVSAGKDIWVGGEKHANGRLVGGRLTAGRSVQAGIVGADVGTRTPIDLSPCAREVQKRYDALKAELNTDVVQHNKLVDEFKRLKLAGPQQAPRRRQLADALKQCRARFEQNKAALALIERERDELFAQLRLIANKTLFRGVRVTLLDDVFNVSREHGPTEVLHIESELRAEPLKK